MEMNIINIGNSKGIIIPDKVLKLLRIKDKVHVSIEGDKLIIKSLNSNPRANWADQFMSANSDNNDSVLISDVFEDEDIDDWTW